MKRWALENYASTSTRVLLFVRLENAVRPGTILKIAKRRGISLPDSCCSYKFAEHMLVKEPVDYDHFYEKWPLILNVISGDREALEQIAYDFVENCFHDEVAYVEVRFSPHLLAGPKLSPAEVTTIILKTFHNAGEQYGVYCNSILCCLRERKDEATEVLDLVRKFQDEGTVGIGLAGDETHFLRDQTTSPEIVAVFREAAYFCIHRTVEAGGISPPKAVWEALDEMSAERIGFGYRIVEDPKLYDYIYTGGYHIETSLVSSHLTNAVCTLWTEHPVLQFLNDGISFSINNDQPLLTGTNLCDEYDVARRQLHITCPEFILANKKAVQAAFINYSERQDLLMHLEKTVNTLTPKEARLPLKHRNVSQYYCPVCIRKIDECWPPSSSTDSPFRLCIYQWNSEFKFDCLHTTHPYYSEKYK